MRTGYEARSTKLSQMVNDPRWRWTQPSCQQCYSNRYPGMSPSKFTEPEAETCCFCGQETHDGIYVRLDPYAVPHPTLLKDD